MQRKFAIIFSIQAFIIVILFWVLVFYGKDEYEALTQDAEEQITMPNRVNVANGQTLITVSQATQTQSDIRSSALQSTSLQEKINSYGNVMGIESLIELRTRYLAAKAEAEVINGDLALSQKEYDRFNALNQDDKNVADKVVIAALANVKGNQAKLLAAESSAKSIADSMRQSWGNTLATLATQTNASALLQSMMENRVVLIQVTLPFDSNEPTKNSQLTVAPTAALSHLAQATYLSPAPIGSTATPGKTYFYYTDASFLRAGMPIKIIRFEAALLSKLPLTKSQNSQSQGVKIPNSAVIWYGGKPWVYQKTNATQFIRLAINDDHEIEGGWFYQGNLKPNDQVVTSGAQLLLSEEFKSQITNENDD